MAQNSIGTNGVEWDDVPDFYNEEKFSDVYDRFSFPVGGWAVIRLVGKAFPIIVHWIPTISKKGGKEEEKAYPVLCHKSGGNFDSDCLYCNLSISRQDVVLSNAIIRDIQSRKPVDIEYPPKGIKFREAGAKWWSPVRVVWFPGSAARNIMSLKALNSKQTKQGLKQFPVDHPIYGCDLSTKFDPGSPGAGVWQFQMDKSSGPLTKEERSYLLYNLQPVYNYMPPVEVCEENVLQAYQKGLLNDPDKCDVRKVKMLVSGNNGGQPNQEERDEIDNMDELKDDFGDTGTVDLSTLSKKEQIAWARENNVPINPSVMRTWSDEKFLAYVQKKQKEMEPEPVNDFDDDNIDDLGGDDFGSVDEGNEFDEEFGGDIGGAEDFGGDSPVDDFGDDFGEPEPEPEVLDLSTLTKNQQIEWARENNVPINPSVMRTWSDEKFLAYVQKKQKEMEPAPEPEVDDFGDDFGDGTDVYGENPGVVDEPDFDKEFDAEVETEEEKVMRVLKASTGNAVLGFIEENKIPIKGYKGMGPAQLKQILYSMTGKGVSVDEDDELSWVPPKSRLATKKPPTGRSKK
jgi:hypothetical protein